MNRTTASEIASIKQRMLDALDSIDSGNYANAKLSISSALTQFGILMNQLELEMSELRQSARKSQ